MKKTILTAMAALFVVSAEVEGATTTQWPTWPIQCTWYYCSQHEVWELISCKWVGFVVAPAAGPGPRTDVQIWREGQRNPFETSLQNSLSAHLPENVVSRSVNHPETKFHLEVWTNWLDRDDPGGKGDYETLSDFVRDGAVCPAPVKIECRVRGSSGQQGLGRSYTCDKTKGGICENSRQRCVDYEVRFLCVSDW